MAARRNGAAGVVVVGAGLAGLRAAETLRGEGYDGRLTLVGAESEPPYDRPSLSKDVLVGARSADTYLRDSEKLASLGLDLRLGQAAREVDLRRRSIVVGDAELPFEGLVVATGARPRTLPVLAGRPGVFTLRTVEHARGLRAALTSARNVIVVGAGFIGSEVAASARMVGASVTIVELEETPLARVLGREVGAALTELHRRNGTELVLGETVVEVADEEPLRLRLAGGRTLDADVVVVGVGVVPETAWLEGSGLCLEDGVVCDASLNAGAPGVYAVGDVASWENELFGRRMRVEHWTNAAEQGRHAALELLHRTGKPFCGSNYVWSDQYGIRIQIVGSLVADECVVVDGSVDDLRFVAWYRRRDRLVGALGVASAKLLLRTRALIEAQCVWSEALALL
jgi:NADPH-dependent 2,4-dienoyl-CoA reductase/sulfur reductase-like enzyme